jgi:putative nucleotidyltransferase with HDIG domain
MGEGTRGPATSGEARRLYAAVAAIVGPVYLVGGSVRDEIMGRPCDDYDFTTPLPADEIEARVRAAGRRPFVAGRRFGTVGCTIDGRKVEITTFRAETYTPHSRRPRVEYLADLADDLARRDFTINAMALHGDTLVDPFGGARDVDDKIVRAVGEARARFEEDPLRMVRAARFASQFGFAVDDATTAAMRRYAHRILGAARERWMLELDKLLVGTNAASAMRLLAETGLLRFMLPELHLQVGYDQDSPWHELPLFEHTLGVLQAAPPDVTMRWAALLHDVGKPYARVERPGRSTYVHHEQIGAEIVERTALYLKWPVARRREVSALVAHHMDADSPLRSADDGAKTVPGRR